VSVILKSDLRILNHFRNIYIIISSRS